jgi:hypothetical protein
LTVLASTSSFTSGQTVSGTVTFEYGVVHQILVGEDYNVFWGASAGGTLQSSGLTTSVPEPTSAFLLGVCLSLGFSLRRLRH